jgi:hypothetical protein
MTPKMRELLQNMAAGAAITYDTWGGFRSYGADGRTLKALFRRGLVAREPTGPLTGRVVLTPAGRAALGEDT